MNPEAYIQMTETESGHWWFSGRRAILMDTLKRMHLPEKAEILEVGCGTGGNLHMLAQFGEVSALEMDASARVIALEKTNNRYDIKEGCCPDNIPFNEKSFDLICMFDVLEHIEKDQETLIALKKLLKENGRILITVPAYQWMFGPHDKFLHHKRRYTVKRLSKTISCSGLRKEKSSYFNTILFPLAAIIRFRDRFFNHNSANSNSDIPPMIINKCFEFLFGFERFILRYVTLPFGLSILCILSIDMASQHSAP